MRKEVLLAGLVGLALSVSVPGASRADETWLGGTPPSVKLHVDSSKQSVDLRLLNKDDLPDAVGVTFFDAFGNSKSIELKSLGSRAGINKSGDVQYVGTLGPEAQSFIGFEIRIPFTLSRLKVIRSDEMNKVE